MIKLVEDLVIQVTKYGYTLMLDRHKVDKSGEPVFDPISYHGNIKEAFNGAVKYLNRKKLSGRTHTLAEAVKIIGENHQQLKELLDNAIKESI